MVRVHVLKRSDRTAFTLMEMLAVLGIVCLLAVLVLGITGHAQRAAREAKAKTDMELIRNALQEYKLQNGQYPDFADWTNRTAGWLPAGFTFRDPWGTDYQYTNRTTESYALYSCGYDGTAGNADDIVSGR